MGSPVSSVDVVIPWSGNCVYRASARSYIASRWQSRGYKVKVGEINGPWCKALAVASALRHSMADTLVITDGDVWTDAGPDAVERVASGELAWSAPFGTVRRLNQESTVATLDGGPLDGRLLKPPFKAVPGGGIVVLRRDVYETAPLDPAFVGWGHEDEAWGMALRCLFGPPGTASDPLWHLWHPPQDKSGTPERRQNQHRRAQYAKARRNPEAMTALLSEARQLLEW